MDEVLAAFDQGIASSYKGGFRIGFLAAIRFTMDGGEIPTKHKALMKFLDEQWEAEGMDLVDMGVRPTDSEGE